MDRNKENEVFVFDEKGVYANKAFIDNKPVHIYHGGRASGRWHIEKLLPNAKPPYQKATPIIHVWKDYLYQGGSAFSHCFYCCCTDICFMHKLGAKACTIKQQLMEG